MRKNSILLLVISYCCLLFLSGCLKIMLRSSPSLYHNFSEAIFEECDPELARESIPANLKIMEGLLKSDPDNKNILRLLCMGYSGYALLFVEADDQARAADLYLRAREYGQRALGQKGIIFSREEINRDDLQKVLSSMGSNDLESLFWFTLSWNGWLNLNLHQPAALGQLTLAQACLERVIEINPEYFHGLPYILMGVIYSARPEMLGGDAEKSENYFNKAFALSRREFFLVHYYYARHYAVRIQDRVLFLKIIKEIEQGDPQTLKEVCLINQSMKLKADELRRMADNLFL